MTTELLMKERTALLKREFGMMDSRRQSRLRSEDLFAYLDEKTGRPFDRVVGGQIFERMAKSDDGSSTVDEFIKVFLEAEDILSHKVDTADKLLRDYRRQRAEAAAKLEELRRTERVNSYGIMDGSTLTVTVIEAHNLPISFQGTPATSVMLSIEGQRLQTEAVRRGNNPSFGETLTFEVKTGMEDLSATVVCKEYGREEFLGHIEIPLNSFRDQQKQEEWYDLLDKNGAQTRGRLHLGVQWIYSRVRYLASVVLKWDEHIKMQEEDKLDFQRDLAALYEPFPGLRNPGAAANQMATIPSGFDQYRPQIQAKLDTSFEVPFSHSEELQRANQVTYIYVVIALVVNYYRADFHDLLVPLLYFMTYFLGRLTPTALRFIKQLVIVACVLDLIWLIVNSSVSFLAPKCLKSLIALVVCCKRPWRWINSRGNQACCRFLLLDLTPLQGNLRPAYLFSHSA
eukprot:TRINITY_DN5171_c0_g1_i2.p1 TRINITY_DN5171_c0_g1~~TRINITY_DN5171_c0_g1_i2.p1  ORF type:complete len:456 (+),score=128.33 TRINITY_DN5171_c0_g1_i2:36-1403(+)